jgi:hypothetical protein
VRIVVPADYGDAVLDLETERVRHVIDDKHTAHRTISDNAQVLNEVAVEGLQAVLAGQNTLNEMPVRVEVVHDGFSVGSLRGSENVDTKVLCDCA